MSGQDGKCTLTGLPEGTYTLTLGELSYDLELIAEEEPTRVAIEI